MTPNWVCVFVGLVSNACWVCLFKPEHPGSDSRIELERRSVKGHGTVSFASLQIPSSAVTYLLDSQQLSFVPGDEVGALFDMPCNLARRETVPLKFVHRTFRHFIHQGSSCSTDSASGLGTEGASTKWGDVWTSVTASFFVKIYLYSR